MFCADYNGLLPSFVRSCRGRYDAVGEGEKHSERRRAANMFRRTRLPAALLIAIAVSVGNRIGAEPLTDSPLRREPRLIHVPADRLVEAELLGTPEVPTLLGYTRRVAHLRDGHTLAVFSYSGTAKANWMFLVDSRDLSHKRYDIPNSDIASHGSALGSDGNLYIMPYATGHAYRFNVGAGTFEPLGEKFLEATLPKGELTWEALGSSDGCIYFGTYPNACLGRYNPATGEWILLKQVAPNTKYVTGFSQDRAGRIHFKAWGPDEVWMMFDPKKQTLERAPQPDLAPPAGSSLPFAGIPKGDTGLGRPITVDGRNFAVSSPTSRLWELGPNGQLILRGDSKSPAESWFLEAASGAVIGIGHFGVVFRYDLSTGEFQRRRLPTLAPGGNPVMFITAVTPRCVIGANYSQQNLFKIDPTNGRMEVSETKVARVTGEPMCATHLKGKAYIGIYTHSILYLYDPAQPFRFQENPRELIELGARYKQTRPRDATTGANLVFMSSDSDYNYLGGALAVIDPGTNQVDVYHHLIRDQNLPTLAYDPATKLLWGGTDRWGQMRSHPPTAESSLIYAFDPRTRMVAATLTPWPGSDVTSVLGVSGNGILAASSAQEIALIDTASRQILYKGAAPIGVPNRIRLGSDGFCYGLSGGTLYRWDFMRNTLTPVATSPGCSMLTESSPGTWVLANRTSIYRAKVPAAGDISSR
jgi:hypothetical protein